MSIRGVIPLPMLKLKDEMDVIRQTSEETLHDNQNLRKELDQQKVMYRILCLLCSGSHRTMHVCVIAKECLNYTVRCQGNLIAQVW